MMKTGMPMIEIRARLMTWPARSTPIQAVQSSPPTGDHVELALMVPEQVQASSRAESATISAPPAQFLGAGEMQHFVDVFDQADVDGALAASVFHSGAIAIPALKQFLRAQQIEVRDVY